MSSKSLKVSLAVVKRTSKELVYYKKEVADWEAKLSGMDESADKYGQYKSAMDESRSMIVDTEARLATAKEALQSELDAHRATADETLVEECEAALSA